VYNNTAPLQQLVCLPPDHDLYLTVYYLHTNTYTASTAAARCPLSTSENNQGRLWRLEVYRRRILTDM